MNATILWSVAMPSSVFTYAADQNDLNMGECHKGAYQRWQRAVKQVMAAAWPSFVTIGLWSTVYLAINSELCRLGSTAAPAVEQQRSAHLPIMIPSLMCRYLVTLAETCCEDRSSKGLLYIMRSRPQIHNYEIQAAKRKHGACCPGITSLLPTKFA